MPKKFTTPKGVRQFPDNYTSAQIESELDKEGIDEYRPYESMGPANVSPKQSLEAAKISSQSPREGRENGFDISTGRYERPNDLAPLNTVASFLRPFLARGGANAAMNAVNALPVPPAVKLAAKAAGYFLTDQAAQEGQKQVFGQRPMGIAEQTIKPENEFLGRAMGTAENALLDFLPAGIARAYGKMKGAPPPTPPPTEFTSGTTSPIAKISPKLEATPKVVAPPPTPSGLVDYLGRQLTPSVAKGEWTKDTIRNSMNATTGTYDVKAMQNALTTPEAAKIFKPSEMGDTRRLLNIVGSGKGKSGDVKLGENGLILSGAVLSGLMEDDEGKKSDITGAVVPLGTILSLTGGKRAALRYVLDSLEGRPTTMPSRKWAKYVLRSALAGTDALLQKTDGTTEEIKVGN